LVFALAKLGENLGEPSLDRDLEGRLNGAALGFESTGLLAVGIGIHSAGKRVSENEQSDQDEHTHQRNQDEQEFGVQGRWVGRGGRVFDLGGTT
jgi:hypothetical protein